MQGIGAEALAAFMAFVSVLTCSTFQLFKWFLKKVFREDG
jgi:hypothetical protein